MENIISNWGKVKPTSSLDSEMPQTRKTESINRAAEEIHVELSEELFRPSEVLCDTHCPGKSKRVETINNVKRLEEVKVHDIETMESTVSRGHVQLESTANSEKHPQKK